VDGGVGVANIKEIAEAGADFFVAGSAILKNPRTQEVREGKGDRAIGIGGICDGSSDVMGEGGPLWLDRSDVMGHAERKGRARP
jgi:hypothetical protein